MSITYGYARVSSREQNEDRQMIAFDEANVPKENIFVDSPEKTLTGRNIGDF